jgi:hypothetical protein
MDKPLPDDFNPYSSEAMETPNWYELGLAALLAVFGWLFKREIGRVDDIEESYVTREELSASIQQIREERKEMREDRQRMHQENSVALQHIQERLDKLVDRSR